MEEDVEEAPQSEDPEAGTEAEPEPEELAETIVPPRRSGSRTVNVISIAGVVIALLAAGAYYLFFLKPAVVARRQVATITAVEGTVKVKKGGTNDWVPGPVGLGLRNGDVVKTEKASGAQLTFSTGNVVKVRPDSVVLISEGEAAVAEEGTAWHVQSGQVNFQLKQNTEIITPTARTKAAANSSGNINVTDEGGTGVKIFQGSAQVATKQGQTITLAGNQAILVDAKGQAGPKIELPPPPGLVAPPIKAELPYVAPPLATAHLTWGEVKGAATYRVAMDYNVVQADLLLSAALDMPGIGETKHDTANLEPGRYFWRVAGVSKEGLEGDFSRVSSFSVIKALEPPPSPTDTAPKLSIDTPDVLASVVQVRGRTDPGASVTVDGHAIKVLADGSFSEFVKKGDKPFIVVKATGANGQVTELTQNVSAN
jgi:Glucodextranase, domain B